MHGSPKSKFDTKDIWKKYDYKKLGIIGEPYFDINFDRTFYLTDTGRRWDGWKASVRDRFTPKYNMEKKRLSFHSTNEIISAVKLNEIPERILFTFHPQRWHDSFFSIDERIDMAKY